MSSKTGPDAPRAWSLAARLTAWYAGSAFLLVLSATGFLYWALALNLDREDDEFLTEKVRAMRTLLDGRLAGDDLRRELEAVAAGPDSARILVRVDARDGGIALETPGMAHALPGDAFLPSDGPMEWRADYRSPAGRSFRLLAVREGSARIEAAMDRTAEVELLAEYRKHLWVVLVAALIVCSIAGYWIARRGIRPLHDVTATARRIRPSNLGERITADHLPAELHELAGTFNAMLDRLEQSFARQSRFSADVAHELRTPVNNLRGGVEVALSRPRTSEEYRDVLGSTLEECERLARLIDSLLFLARAENPRTQVEREPLDLGKELAAVSEFYEAAAAEAGVRLSVTANGPAPASVNRPLFQRAVSNLVANALDHVAPGGAVTLSAASDDASTVVEVSDTGHGIPPEHLPHVFDRFYRADAVRGSGGNHLGLGLALVRSITELHGGTVAIASEIGHGTRVTLKFPKSA